MKISKKNLLEQLEMDEMAFKPKGVQAARSKPPKYKPYFSPENNTDIPDAWIINKNQIAGEEEAVVLLHGAEFDAFINENQGLIDKLNEVVGGNLKIYEGNKTKYHPRNLKVGIPAVVTGKKYSEKEAILRKFNPILKKQLTDKVNKHLIECGLPPIQTYENREFVDKYTEISNFRLDWESHDYDFYDNVIDFAKSAKDLLYKGITSVNVYRTHMPRQYNPGANWSALRKTEKMNSSSYQNDPLTPVYKLPKRGYEKDDKDVAICTTLHITGKLETPHHTETGLYKFTWSARIQTAVGKKLKEEMRIASGKFTPDKDLKAQKIVEVNSNFDVNNMTIMDIQEIVESFHELLNDLSAQVLAIEPRKELLARVRVQQSDITNRPLPPANNPQLNEEELIQIVKDKIKELKK